MTNLEEYKLFVVVILKVGSPKLQKKKKNIFFSKADALSTAD